jgi:hypothetical protein
LSRKGRYPSENTSRVRMLDPAGLMNDCDYISCVWTESDFHYLVLPRVVSAYEQLDFARSIVHATGFEYEHQWL